MHNTRPKLCTVCVKVGGAGACQGSSGAGQVRNLHQGDSNECTVLHIIIVPFQCPLSPLALYLPLCPPSHTLSATQSRSGGREASSRSRGRRPLPGEGGAQEDHDKVCMRDAWSLCVYTVCQNSLKGRVIHHISSSSWSGASG